MIKTIISYYQLETILVKCVFYINAVGIMLFTGGIVVAQDKYTVALDGTFAPHAMPKIGGGIEGFNVDLATMIGERLGVEMDIVATQFSGILPGLQAGTYDFVVAPTTITDERAANYLFSEGYLNTDFQFVVRNDAADITDLKGYSGQVIAVNKGSAYDSWARELAAEIGWTVESYGNNTDCLFVVCSVRSVEVIEALPFAQFGFEIDIVFVAEQLVELLPV